MKKILIIANSDSAIYKFRKELVEELCKGYKVYVAIPFGEYMQEISTLGCEYINVFVDRHGINPLKDLKLYSAYRTLINKIKPDAVLTYTIKPNIYGCLAANRKGIFTIANITGVGSAIENGGILRKVVLEMYRIAFRNIGNIFFQNSENLKLFRELNIGKGRYTLLPGSGVNTEKFSYIDYPSDNKLEFAFISRIMKEKGINLYVEVAKKIKEKYPLSVFHVCGPCEQDYEEYLNKLHAQGIINYHGLIKDVRTILKEVHCVIHPTYYPEGMSNVLLESCASGRPIITTDRSGCKEAVDNGVNGYIVKQNDLEDLYSKVEQFCALPYKEKKQLGIEGRKKVEREFDRKIVIEHYLEHLKKI